MRPELLWITPILAAIVLAGLMLPGTLSADDGDRAVTQGPEPAADEAGGVPDFIELPTAGDGRMVVMPAQSRHVIHATVDPGDHRPVVECDR